MTSCKICNRKLEDNKFYKSNKSKCKDCIKAIRIEQIVTNKTWNHIQFKVGGDLMKFDITIIETLSRTVSVDAENYNEALEKVEDMYDRQEIILDSSDFEGKVIE